MKKFTAVKDVENVEELILSALDAKRNPLQNNQLGAGKTIGLVFMNPSLRTRLSTEKAAQNLGLNVLVIDVSKDGWKLELEDGPVMDGDTQEHLKDAIKVLDMYCDLLAVRCFPGLENAKEDYAEPILNAFIQNFNGPVISLESATRHPLQSLADLITIKEKSIDKPKVVVSWAPHPKKLPQAVVNSFLEWVVETNAEVVLAHPKGYELSDEFVSGVVVNHNQDEALAGADFVYCKNWSSFSNYGETPEVQEDWTITDEKMKLTNNGQFMHCLPIRRNVVATDNVIDNSLVYQQAGNRVWAAQAVLKTLLQ